MNKAIWCYFNALCIHFMDRTMYLLSSIQSFSNDPFITLIMSSLSCFSVDLD